MTSGQTLLEYAVQIGALELLPEGRRLKSGRISPYFFNSGLFTSGDSLANLINAYAAHALRMSKPFTVVYGPPYKGIPLAVALASKLSRMHVADFAFSFSRKELKDHGEGGILVGASLRGKNVLIVDDVMTTGDSSGGAVEMVRAEGGNPVGCIIGFDRQEKAVDGELSAVQSFALKYSVPVFAAASLTDLIQLLKAHASAGESREMLDKILTYRAQYGMKSST